MNISAQTLVLVAILHVAIVSVGYSDDAKPSLSRADPYAQNPPQQILTLGNPRVGMVSIGTSKLARVGESDYWLIDQTTNHPRQKIALVQFDREVGECLTRQLLEAGGNWSFSGVRNLLFAGRTEEEASREAMHYSCFELKTNKNLWNFDRRRKVIASTFSADHRSLIVLTSIPGKEEHEFKGATAVQWLDIKTGQVTRDVEIDGITTFNRQAVIEDSKHGTYLARRCDEGAACFFIPAAGDQAEPLDQKLGLSESSDLEWTIRVQPKEERWITFHQSERLTLFERRNGELVRAKKVESGGSFYANDDCSNVRFSPEGDRLVIGSDYRTFIIDLKSPDKIEKELDYGTYYSDFTSDGEFLIFWDRGGAWPVRTKGWVNLRTEAAKKSAFHCCPIETVSVSPDGKMIATSDYGRVLIWAAQSGKLLAELTSPRLDKKERCYMHRPAWNLENGVIYAGDGYDVLEWKIADFVTSPSVSRLKGEVAFGALKSRSTRPMLIDVFVDKSGEHIVEVRSKSLRYRRSSNFTASRDLSMGRFDLRSSPRKFSIDLENQNFFVSSGGDCFKIDLSGKAEPIRAASGLKGLASDAFLAFSGITRGGEFKMNVQSLLSEKIVEKSFPFGDSRIQRFEVTPDGSKVALITSGPESRVLVKLLDIETQKILAETPIASRIESLEFSADGKFLVLGGYNRASYVWDLSEIPNGQ